MNSQEELERRKRLHEAEQGLSKRQIAGLVVLHALMTDTPEAYIKRNGNMDGGKLINDAIDVADAFLRR